MALDHTAHPDVIDTIVASSAADTLFAVRATSKGLRDTADRVLLSHVELRLRRDPGRLEIVGLDGRPLPSRPELVTVADLTTFEKWYGVDDDAEGAGQGDADDEGGDDLGVGNTDPVLTAHTIASFSALCTLRRMGDGVISHFANSAIFLQVDTLVDFYDMHDYPASHAGHQHWFNLPEINHPCHNMRRYVLHIRIDEASMSADDNVEALFQEVRAVEDMYKTLRDAVFVIHPPARPTPDAIMSTILAAMSYSNELYTMMADAGTTEPLSITFVGLETIEALQPSPAPVGEEAERLQGTMGILRHWKDVAAAGGFECIRVLDDDDPKPSMRFVSMDDWLAELGDRREIEGEWVGRRG
ncbi:uncharacterized protein LOC62_04G005262 [Vanrija pseudolonga]|uniref:Uncharacterized protein n=1 Tax=Vanrija pseudolonga TaxID=143232 RepID=A0AAF0YBM2_9TREE|nr:hypothetical protein LOC62_04G005262 [Vanrija pseudolonga]